MNYIIEINSFYDWIETNTISDSAINLWHALMAVNNKSGWKMEFSVAISTLMTKTKLSKSSIIRARNQLKQSGRIDFKERTGNQSCVYNLIAFQGDTQNITQSVTQTDTQTDTQTNTQSDTITKLNKTKLKQTILKNELEANFETISKNENFGNEVLQDSIWLEAISMQNKIPVEKITDWIEKFNLKLIVEIDTKNSKSDYAGHFSRWLPGEVLKLEKENKNAKSSSTTGTNTNSGYQPAKGDREKLLQELANDVANGNIPGNYSQRRRRDET